ncbi:serine/threonine-protein kinase [Longispora sp. NPDC051575]|uniref:serine/threonine-protein kinase n=1 Tax=Longispora sp. NPDC051575 TaxID=3154943 RepID=UPI0034430433
MSPGRGPRPDPRTDFDPDDDHRKKAPTPRPAPAPAPRSAPGDPDFAALVAAVHAAGAPGELFGTDQPARWYRRMVRILHPDTTTGDRATATAAFARLAELWAEHEGRGGAVLETRTRRYRMGPLLATGDLANLFRLGHADGDVVLKLPRSPGDSDLIEREATALAQLARDGDPRHRAYVPRLVETFRHEEPGTGVRRTANILSDHSEFVSLARVAESYPDGVDPRDVAWMWRRLLVALGHAHRAGVLHGAVLPEHVLIHPREHGLVLVDWCYSVTTPDTPVPALVARHRDRYPPEVPDRRPASAGTDVHMATSCMRDLMGTRAHPALLRFAAGCSLPDQRRRPQDAWRLLAEFDELLEDLYGPRTFRPFTLKE